MTIKLLNYTVYIRNIVIAIPQLIKDNKIWLIYN